MSNVKKRIPEYLFISVGGHYGPSYQLDFKKGKLIYTLIHDDQENLSTHMINPTSKQWQRFWGEIDAIGVWNWKSRYDIPSIMDGTSWRVEIEHNGKNVTSSGSNAFPGETADKSFNPFLIAVRELIGNKPFS